MSLCNTRDSGVHAVAQCLMAPLKQCSNETYVEGVSNNNEFELTRIYYILFLP